MTLLLMNDRPTEHHLAKISNAKHAFVVSSGMGALDVILRGLKKDDEVIAGEGWIVECTV